MCELLPPFRLRSSQGLPFYHAGGSVQRWIEGWYMGKAPVRQSSPSGLGLPISRFRQVAAPRGERGKEPVERRWTLPPPHPSPTPSVAPYVPPSLRSPLALLRKTFTGAFPSRRDYSLPFGRRGIIPSPRSSRLSPRAANPFQHGRSKAARLQVHKRWRLRPSLPLPLWARSNCHILFQSWLLTTFTVPFPLSVLSLFVITSPCSLLLQSWHTSSFLLPFFLSFTSPSSVSLHINRPSPYFPFPLFIVTSLVHPSPFALPPFLLFPVNHLPLLSLSHSLLSPFISPVSFLLPISLYYPLSFSHISLPPSSPHGTHFITPFLPFPFILRALPSLFVITLYFQLFLSLPPLPTHLTLSLPSLPSLFSLLIIPLYPCFIPYSLILHLSPSPLSISSLSFISSSLSSSSFPCHLSFSPHPPYFAAPSPFSLSLLSLLFFSLCPPPLSLFPSPLSLFSLPSGRHDNFPRVIPLLRSIKLTHSLLVASRQLPEGRARSNQVNTPHCLLQGRGRRGRVGLDPAAAAV
ncbi:hypothetical protein C7M84_006187 [Penaeus vannamei]|uniref:Uncharacterized protein n=1 Tax=Penaeus vannamei TaxID=6689 RepID=A0A3R7P4N6_PENVA|nr:hypothetical protein C7M84_006187 [Penaeus vannamei]